MNGINLGPEPAICLCPSCGSNMRTVVKVEPNTKTHLMALALCFFGGCFCMCIPYCMDSCQNRNHHCSVCNSYLGSYHT